MDGTILHELPEGERPIQVVSSTCGMLSKQKKGSDKTKPITSPRNLTAELRQPEGEWVG